MNAGLIFMKKNIKPLIYKYHDVVMFLKEAIDFYKYKEEKSLRDLAKEMKIASGLLPMVLSRKRNLTEELLKKIMKNLDYNKPEIEFAQHLRTIGFSEDYLDRKNSLNKINKIKKYRQLNANESEFYKYLSQWYFVAIKEMSDLPDFSEDVEWIQARLAYKVTQKEIETALKFLKANKILIYKNKKLVASQKDMNCEEGIFKLSLGAFHKQILELAGTAIDTVPRDKRKILGHTLTVDKKNIEQINDILIEAFEKIKKLNSDPAVAEEVYHVEFISIPVTRKVESK